MNIKYPLFLPNVTKTYTDSQNRLTDETVRLEEMRKALFRLLERGHFDEIVIVDGSDCAVLSEAEISAWRAAGITIEQLKFQQDRELVRRFGKSHGEMQITLHMLDHSTLVRRAGGFYKLSPRYSIENIDRIMPLIKPYTNAFYFYHPPGVRAFKSFAVTIFYKVSVEFYRKHLAGSIAECSMEVSGYLETIYGNRLRVLPKRPLGVAFPFCSGVAGTTGKAIGNRFFSARNLLSQCGLLGYRF